MLKGFDEIPELNSALAYVPTMVRLALPAGRDRSSLRCVQLLKKSRWNNRVITDIWKLDWHSQVDHVIFLLDISKLTE